MRLEVAVKSRMQVPRSTNQPVIKISTAAVFPSKINPPLLGRFFHLLSSNTYYILVHTKAPWHQEMRSKRDCCCTRGGRGTRWPGGQAIRRGASCYTQQRTCENLLFVCFFLVGFHRPAWLWLGGNRSRDCVPARATLTAQSTRHRARPGAKLEPS